MKKRKKKSAQEILIRVSALAVMAAPVPSARAQSTTLNIVCKQDIGIGNLIASGCMNGTYAIKPNGAHTDMGCLLIIKSATAGVCTITTKKGPATKSAKITFAKTTFKLTSGGATVTLKDLRMRARSKTASVTKLTVSATALQNTVTIDVGGSLHYVDLQTAGKYSGKVQVVVNW